ncbi:MAG: Na+/H+ antiporter NhaC family protein [Eubacteriales bacterium]
MEILDFGWLSILPPVIAIVLALITKEVISSLLIGIVSGAVIFNSFAPIATIETTFSLMADKMSDNASMILFLALLGALVAVVTLAGGSEAYGKWASAKIKTQRGASLATAGLGLLIFIDDYFNCLTVGTVMRPVTDKNNISRAKLAYLIDATAGPICMIAPISSWGASVISTIADIEINGAQAVENPLAMFMSSIPFNFYALLTIIAVIYFSISNKEIGSMADPEMIETSINAEADISNEVEVSDKGTIWDLIVPVLSLIVITVLFMLYTGGYFEGGISLADGFGDASVNMSLVYGAALSLIIAFIMYIPRKLATVETFMSAVTVGLKSMVPAITILTLAWSIGGICSSDYLNTGGYVAGLMEAGHISYAFLPAIIFAVAGLLAFSTGTAWGTFGILVPIMVPIIITLGRADMIAILLGAIFSGSVLGDHCSPISDTTILSSAGAGCNHIIHVSTQIPYALTVASGAFVGFIVGGFTNNVLLSFICALVTMFIVIFFVTRMTADKYKKTEA